MSEDSEFSLQPDVRMEHFIGGFDEAGKAIPQSATQLNSVASAWPITSATPEGDAGLLTTSRKLFVHSYFVYEFLTVGVLWSLQAVEASLRTRLDSSEPFIRLIHRAREAGLIDEDAAEHLDAGRRLRNMFSHPRQQTVWTFAMARGAIHASHDVVASLFPSDEVHTQVEVQRDLTHRWAVHDSIGGFKPRPQTSYGCVSGRLCRAAAVARHVRRKLVQQRGLC